MIMQCMERQDWDAVRALLSTFQQHVDKTSSADHPASKRNKMVPFRSGHRKKPKLIHSSDTSVCVPSLALHQACRFTAPADIVLSILSIKPKSAAQREPTKNEYPLHTAARKGLPIDVIEALADGYPPAMTAQDSNGRTPLHLSCLSGHIYPYLATVFCRRAPSVIAIEDDDGSAPMELFMHSDISKSRFAHKCMEVLDVLHKASSLYWENRRRQNEMYRMTTMRKVSVCPPPEHNVMCLDYDECSDVCW
eukprot:CAMPEP_0196803296 /NCGR_PEP_ID=MMETSP1362-20130617/2641_1 /TAXON_ID=163516 /ORGANISM="Leptocylindrus danicus, Strain CCMP1856" /LENGTH=249 /DNA_ID=CAMNT_0042174757 /DNA_START=77 /DNA_END=823 /DNA_ORIENTATION=-